MSCAALLWPMAKGEWEAFIVSLGEFVVKDRCVAVIIEYVPILHSPDVASRGKQLNASRAQQGHAGGSSPKERGKMAHLITQLRTPEDANSQSERV